MKTTTVKVQIPLDKSLRDDVQKQARAQGFSSLQEFTRVLYATIVQRGLQFDLNAESPAVRLSKKAEARYARMLADYEAGRQAGTGKSFNEVDDFLAELKST